MEIIEHDRYREKLRRRRQRDPFLHPFRQLLERAHPAKDRAVKEEDPRGCADRELEAHIVHIVRIPEQHAKDRRPQKIQRRPLPVKENPNDREDPHDRRTDDGRHKP